MMMEKELPKGWVNINIPDLVAGEGIFNDGDWIESKDQDPDGDVRLIQLADIGINEFRNRSNRHLTSIRANELNCSFLNKDDVLIARMPDPIGRACIFPLDGKFVTVVDVAFVRPNPRVIQNQLLVHFVNSPQFSKQINDLASGTTRQRISRKNLGTIPFPLPPLSEQQRIAAKLDSLFAHIENTKTRLEKVPTLLKNFRQAVLTQAVTGKLTEELGFSQWQIKRVDQIAELLSGFAFKSNDFVDDGIQLIRMGNLYDNKLDIKRNPAFLPVTLDEKIISKYSLKNDDILLSLTGTKYKRDYGYAIRVKTNQQLLLNQRILALTPKVKPDFLLYLLRGDEFRDKFFSFETGGVNQGNVGVRNVASIELGIPSEEEQTEIVRRVESLFAKADAIEAKYKLLKEKIDNLPQTILAKAFRGELVEQLESDGDARELLEEIKRLKVNDNKK